MSGYSVQIWVDAEEGLPTHLYIARSDGAGPHHYARWDQLLSSHHADIIGAAVIVVRP